VDRGSWTAAKLAKIHDHENSITVDRGPWTVLTTDNLSDAPTQEPQVRPVYKRSNSAGKPPFLATFGAGRRAFQVGIQAQHVVAAT
jgi:hypothetical protein